MILAEIAHFLSERRHIEGLTFHSSEKLPEIHSISVLLFEEVAEQSVHLYRFDVRFERLDNSRKCVVPDKAIPTIIVNVSSLCKFFQHIAFRLINNCTT